MKCQYCEQPATVHLTDVLEDQRRELHLCEECARKHEVLPGPQHEVNLPAVLQLLLKPPEAAADRHCPACGLSYAEFRRKGRLGCPHDYEAFRAELLPLVESIHRAARHCGKTPRRKGRPDRQAALAALHRQLHAAVSGEQYEEAARLRDLIRQKEGADEPR